MLLSYDFGDEGTFGGTRVSSSVNNLLDEAPPFIDTGRVVTGNAPEPYDAANASIIGGTIALTVSKKF